MVEYTCDRCGMKFDQKIVFDRHLKRKAKCPKKKFNSKTNKKMEHKCGHCKRNFSRKDSLKRHITTCKKKKDKNTIKIKNSNKGDNNKIINKNSNNVYNIYGPIIMIPFGRDGVNCIDSETFKKLMNSNKNIIETLISNINLNPKKPQHHNVYYGDIKSSYGEVYEKKKWVKMKISEILDTLIDTKIGSLNDYLSDMKDFLNEKTRNKIKETIENFDYTRPNSRKKLKSYLKPIIYNHKDMIIKTRKINKEQEEEIFRKEQEEAEREAEQEERQMKQKNRK